MRGDCSRGARVEPSHPTLSRMYSDNSIDDNLDRSGGSGSLTTKEAWVENQSRVGPNDNRSITRTTFYDDAATDGPPQKHRDPDDRTSWSELAQWNDGMWHTDRKEQNFEADLRRWSQTFCNKLSLTRYQTERVEYIVMEIDLDSFKQYQLSAEKIIMGVISLVVDSDTSVDDIDEWEMEDWIIYDDDFEELMDGIEMERSDLWTARKILNDKTDFFAD